MTDKPMEPQKRPDPMPVVVARVLARPEIVARVTNALGGHVSGEFFLAQCAISARDPILADCSAESLVAAFLTCAQLGLVPGKHHGHVALIPRKGVVDVMPQWQGYLALMRRSKGIKSIRVDLVHERDSFTYANGVVSHFYDPFEDRGFGYPVDGKTSLRGGYLVAEMENGEKIHHFVALAKILQNAACAQTANVWRKWFAEMSIKTVYRDAWARRVIPFDLETGARLGAASEADDAALGNDPERPALPATTPQASVVERLREKLDVPAPKPAPIPAPLAFDPSDYVPPEPPADWQPGREPGEEG